ncbi:MAG: copper resistance protein NlpE N-terminal domain-containing protein [Sphingobacteriales bacterium]|nr:copper resistance protein NlpE N-terminal domain-containing protein [Sphingobacteriales bacterium]
MKKFRILFLSAFILTALWSCKDNTKQEEQAKEPETENVVKVDRDNGQTSLDWAGVYEGTLPCADCEGNKTTIEINKDNTYTIKEDYSGKGNFEEKGTISWDDAGGVITMSDSKRKYKVGENVLLPESGGAKVITGELADKYCLKTIRMIKKAFSRVLKALFLTALG